MRIGRASSLDAARTTWVSAVGQLGAGEGDRLAGRLGEARELVGGEDAQAELRAAGGDAGLVVGDLDLDAAGGQGPDDVGRQPARAGRRRRRRSPDDRDLDGDRELEVGAGEAELVAGELDPDPGEHGQGGAPPGRRPAGGAEGLDEDITLASELHAGLAFYRRLVLRNEGVVVGAVDWG